MTHERERVMSEARAEAERRHAAGELYDLSKSRLTTFEEGARWAVEQAAQDWTDEQLDAAYAAFQSHGRGSEFNEFGERVCSECGYAYSWPEGDKRRYHVEHNRSKRHVARAALEAARAHKPAEGGQG